MNERLLGRLLVAAGVAALTAGCGGKTEGETGQSSPQAGSAGAATGGSGGSGAAGSAGQVSAGGTAGSAGQAGAGGISGSSGQAGVGGSGGSGGSGGAGGSGGSGAGGSQGGNGAAAGTEGCVELAVCKEGKLVNVCIQEGSEPPPYEDCGGGQCALVGTMCPQTFGQGGSEPGGSGGAGGSEAGSAGVGGGVGGSGGAGGSEAGSSGSGGQGAAGQGGAGGNPGKVSCAEGAPCVEDAWCQYPTQSSTPKHCVNGAYNAGGDSVPFEVKVCISKSGACSTLDDPEIYAKVSDEFSWNCSGVSDVAAPLVQVASNGEERCCYKVTAVCVGRPLMLAGALRVALLHRGAWG